jgi:hypothetical protein
VKRKLYPPGLGWSWLRERKSQSSLNHITQPHPLQSRLGLGFPEQIVGNLNRSSHKSSFA